MYLFFDRMGKATLLLWLAFAAYSAVHLWFALERDWRSAPAAARRRKTGQARRAYPA